MDNPVLSFSVCGTCRVGNMTGCGVKCVVCRVRIAPDLVVGEGLFEKVTFELRSDWEWGNFPDEKSKVYGPERNMPIRKEQMVGQAQARVRAMRGLPGHGEQVWGNSSREKRGTLEMAEKRREGREGMF